MVLTFCIIIIVNYYSRQLIWLVMKSLNRDTTGYTSAHYIFSRWLSYGQGMMVKMPVLLWFALHCPVSECVGQSLQIWHVTRYTEYTTSCENRVVVLGNLFSAFMHVCVCVCVCTTQMKSEFAMFTQTQQSQKIKGWAWQTQETVLLKQSLVQFKQNKQNHQHLRIIVCTKTILHLKYIYRHPRMVTTPK